MTPEKLIKILQTLPQDKPIVVVKGTTAYNIGEVMEKDIFNIIVI